MNQTIVETEINNKQHISREVRQRVWKGYGGRCAECGAGENLEFDHIVPVAEGGSNSDSNVQLLCRKCNLKKSDNIECVWRHRFPIPGFQQITLPLPKLRAKGEK